MKTSLNLTKKLVNVAMGRESADMVIRDGVWVSVQSGEIIPNTDIAIVDGHRSVDIMGEVGWLDGDVWFAHSVYVNEDEINTYAKHNCGVTHCPSSNMRLASGIGPIKGMLAAGVDVGLGVDGSASKEGQLVHVDEGNLIERHNEAAKRLLEVL